LVAHQQTAMPVKAGTQKSLKKSWTSVNTAKTAKAPMRQERDFDIGSTKIFGRAA
jgi:hypothetical protein